MAPTSLDKNSPERPVAGFDFLPLLEGPDCGLALIGLDGSGRIVFWSEGASRIFGYSGAEELNSREFGAMVWPEADGPERLRELLERALSNGGWRGEITHRDAAGVLFPARLSIFPRDSARGAAGGYLLIAQRLDAGIWPASSIQPVVSGGGTVSDASRLAEALQSLAWVGGQSMDAMVALDNGFRVVFFNQAAEAMFGYSAEAMLGQPLDCLLPLRCRSAHPGQIRSFGQSGQSNRRMGSLGSVFGLRADGTEFPIEASISRLDLGGQFLYTGVLRDDSERVKAEISIQQSQQFLISTLDSLTSHIAVVEPTGELIACNSAWSRFAHQNGGLSSRCGVGANYLDVCAKATGPAREEVARAAGGILSVMHGECGEFNLEYRCPSGNGFLWFLLRVTPFGPSRPGRVVVAHLDISERKVAELALRESQERYRDLFENAHDLIQSVTPDGRILYENPAWREIMGYVPEEICELKFPSVLVGDSALRWAELVAAATPEKGTDRSEWRVRTKDGREIELEGTTNCRFENGRLVAVLSILRDISQRKRMETALVSSRDDLERRVAERTAALAAATEAAVHARADAERANLAKSEFLSRMSHELRTPLNAILGFGQLLEINDLGEQDTESVGHILSAGRHLLSLINEVLDIARIETGNMSLSPEPVPLTPVLREVMQMMAALAQEKGIRLEAHLHAGRGWHVKADQQRLRQIVLNLLSNAIKYNRISGRVTVECREVGDGRVRITVTDTGAGLRPDEMARLFVPFERLDAESSGTEGTGIGLALCKRLAEAMNGNVGVESTVGKGSSFWVELPASDNPMMDLNLPDTPVAPPAPAASPAAERVRRVLYIEDNLSNLKVVEAVLAKRPNVNLISAMQGSIGLELARSHRPDLILLDLHLPDIPGETVLASLRSDLATNGIPVVILSADAMPRQISKLLAAGARSYVTKPIDLMEFLRVVDEHLKLS